MGLDKFMIDQINDLPFELLVHTFSFLPTRDLIQTSRVCKSWACLVADDRIWQEAFMKIWHREPDMYKPSFCPWSATRRQRVHYNVDQVENLSGGYLWCTKDGRFKLAVVSQTAFMTAFFEPGGRLNRSVCYLPSPNRTAATVVFNHKSDLLAIGRESGEIDIMSNAELNGFIKVGSLELPNEQDRRLELTKLIWQEHTHLIAVYCCLEEANLCVFDVETQKVLAWHHIDRYVSEFAQISLLFKSSNLFWLESGLLRSTHPDTPLIRDIKTLVRLSDCKLLIILGGSSWIIYDSAGNGTLNHITIPSASYVTGFHKTDDKCTRLVYIDSEGWQWLVILNGESGAHEFIRFHQGLHDSSIKDIYFGKSIIIILRATVLAIHDATSLRLLLWQPVQSRKKRSQSHGDDVVEPSDQPTKQLLHVLEEEGIVLFQWGEGLIQVWNFGRSIKALEPLPAAAPKGAAQKKATINQQIKSEYEEWQEERQEAADLERLRNRHNPAGMTEDELLALALSLSIADGRTSQASLKSASIQELSTDDEELRRILELSRFDQ